MGTGRPRPNLMVQAPMMSTGFRENWFDEHSQAALTELVREVNQVEGLLVEIGSWEGRSTVAIANATDREVHAVDTWEGSYGEISADLAAQRDVHATFIANVTGLTKGNVVPHRMGWREYVPTIEGPVALAFIDAEHSYREVHDNIRALLPKMAPGGIICGDDNHHPPVQQAVVDIFGGDVTVKASLWIHRVPDGSPSLERLYNRQCGTPSDIYLHLPRMVALVEELNATSVLELGTRTGVSTIAWLYALEQTGGHLTSIDLDAKPPIGDFEHWEFIQGDDTDAELIQTLAPADIVFIDTSHLYEHTRFELEAYRHLVKPGGVIVCHDTELERPEGAPAHPRFPVRTAIEEFVTAHGFEWVNIPDCWGLGIIRIEGGT